MADIATLGLAVDSRPVTAAVKELDKLTAAGKKAEEAATGLKATAQPSFGAVEAAAKRAGVSVEEMRARVAKASESASKNFPQMGRGADEAAKKVGGLTDALGGGKGGSGDGVAPAMDRAERSGSNFANTLTRRFILGYAVSQVRELGRSLVNLTADMARVGDIGRLTSLGSGGVQGILGAAGNKGIASDAFSGAMVAFNQQIPLAKSGIGSLGELLRGNRITVTDTADAFFKVADLVKNAATDTARLSILQQAGLPATMEMARFMGQGALELKKQSAEVSKLSDAQIEAARKLDDRFNTMWTNFKTAGKKAVVDLATAMDETGDAVTRFFLRVNPKLAGPLGIKLPEATPTRGIGSDPDRNMTEFMSGRKGPVTVDVAKQKAEALHFLNIEQQRLGLYGATTTAAEARLAVELQLRAAGLNGVGIDKARAETLARLAEEQNLGITAMKASADAARVEAETIGMSVGKAQEYTAIQTAMNQAKRAGYEHKPEEIEAIRQEAAALGEAAQHADTMRWSFTNLVQGPMQTFRSQIASGASAWDAFKSAGASALNAISTKLMDMAANQLWESAFGGKSSGGGLMGLLGGLFGGGSSPGNIGGTGGGLGGLYAKGGVPSSSSDISRYSNQIVTKPTFFAKGGNVMGEAGPEAVMPLVRTPDGNLGVRSQGGAGTAPVSVTINQTMTFNNADPGSEARLRQEIAQSKNQAVSEATQAVARLHGNAPGNYLPRGR